jgi:hypothetical protein
VKKAISYSLFIIVLVLLFHSDIQAQEFRHYYQIYTDDTIQQIKCIEYDNDSTGAILEFKLSEDKTDIHLLNYNGSGKVKVSYLMANGEIRDITRYKCNIHSLPQL